MQAVDQQALQVQQLAQTGKQQLVVELEQRYRLLGPALDQSLTGSSLRFCRI